jgi:hypothetical protein
MEFLNKILRAQSGEIVVQRGMPLVRLPEREKKKYIQLEILK